METKQTEREQARNMYFGSNMSQQEIADKLNINRKTLYVWINEGGWRHAKYAAAHAPALLLDQYYEQLGKLNQNIAARENPWPTIEEAGIIRKIMLSVRQLTGTNISIGQTISVFHDFIEYLRVKENNLAMAKEYIKPMDRYVKKMQEDVKWLSYNTIRNEETHFEAEYAEYLKTQSPAPGEQTQNPSASNQQAVTPQTDLVQQPEQPIEANNDSVILSSPKDILSLPNDPITNSPKDRPLTYEEVKKKVEAIQLSKQRSVQAQPQTNSTKVIPGPQPGNDQKDVILTPPKSQRQNPNLPAARHDSSKPTSPLIGGVREGLPIPHPTQPRYLTNYDIQKMMETPQTGSRPKHFNPKRF